MRKVLSSFGVIALGLGGSMIASPAQALSLTDCQNDAGNTSGNLRYDSEGNYCELIFGAGDYSWTPALHLTDLQSLVVAGGSGARISSNAAYAGAGGQVIYADLSNLSAGTNIYGTVGAGGSSDTASTGGNSTIRTNPSTISVGAEGIATDQGGGNYCWVPGFGGGFTEGFGEGALGLPSMWDGTGDCGTPGAGPVVNVDQDTDGTSPLSLFVANTWGGNTQYGQGGFVTSSEDDAPNQNPGSGASILVNTDSDTVSMWTQGVAGTVVFLWTAVPNDSSDNSLASTGSNDTLAFAIGSSLIAGGIATMRLASRRRR